VRTRCDTVHVECALLFMLVFHLLKWSVVHAQCPNDVELAILRGMSTAPAPLALTSECVALLQRLLLWPASRLFPVLDLLRLAVLDPATAGGIISQREEIVGAINMVHLHALSPGAGEVNHMMGLRFCCNLIASARADSLPAGGAIALIAPILEATAAAEVHTAPRAGARLALATLLLNAATLLSSQCSSCEDKTPVVCALQQFLTALHSDVEVRLQCGVGSPH
jgi:hypothetical protein